MLRRLLGPVLGPGSLPIPLLATLLLATLLLSAFLLPAPSAAAAAPDDASLGPGRVVLVPINLGIRPEEEVKPGLEPVWQEILQHFGTGERPVTALERTSAQGLWDEVRRELRDEGRDDVYEAYARYARRIAEQLEYSRIVFPSLVIRAAELRGTSATWDGVRRAVDSPVGGETVQALSGSDLLVSQMGVRGELAAASLHVAVLDAAGELRFEGAGGLSLLQHLVRSREHGGPELDAELRDDAFANRDELREGIEAAFRQPLPASRAH